MGQTEDIYMDVYNQIKNLGLKKEFDEYIEKMSNKTEFKHMEQHRKWEYAKDKVIKKYSKIKKHEK